MVGFTKLTELHNEWLKDMITGKEDSSLMASRGAYKTTCVSIALAICIVIYPNKRNFFLRKTDPDVKEIIKQVKSILLSKHMQYFVQVIYGVNLKITIDNQNEIQTNLTTDFKGTSQLVAQGIGGSLTGKHFERIWTDDISNINDRISRAEREKTKLVYQELQNIKNEGGRFFNTLTKWHKEDVATLMPNMKVYDYHKMIKAGIFSKEYFEAKKKSMIASLFAANYELKIIANEDVFFKKPKYFDDVSLLENGICQIDASYGGQDGTAFAIAKKTEGKIYIYGKLWNKHIDNCIPEILDMKKKFLTGRTYCEDNGDKGYLKKRLREYGDTVSSYHESTNKFIKITTELYRDWDNVYFYKDTDQEYIQQICDYNEHSEHDDCPDNAAVICRLLHREVEHDLTGNIFI